MRKNVKFVIVATDIDKIRWDFIMAALYGLGFEDIRHWFYENDALFSTNAFDIQDNDTEKSLAKEFREAVWKGNGAYCKVKVTVHYAISSIDATEYEGTERQYTDWKENK